MSKTCRCDGERVSENVLSRKCLSCEECGDRPRVGTNGRHALAASLSNLWRSIRNEWILEKSWWLQQSKRSFTASSTFIHSQE